MKHIILLLLITLFGLNAVAQTTYNRRDYSSKPLWIKMMNDTSVNYYETVKAFRQFFKRRPLPKEPNEIEGTDRFEIEVGLENEEDGATMAEKLKEREREKQRQQTLEARRIARNEPSYSAEVRAFRGWFYEVKPWVLPDGRIVGPKEQQAIVDRQHSDQKQVERLNNKR